MRVKKNSSLQAGRSHAFTLAEVVMCIAIVAVLFGGVITAYVQTSNRAEWSGYSLAAQAIAIQQLEQAKAAKWDALSCEITNVPTVTSSMLDLPYSGTNIVWATNYATVSQISFVSGAPISVYLVKVDTVWPYRSRGVKRYFTNSVANYYAPD